MTWLQTDVSEFVIRNIAPSNFQRIRPSLFQFKNYKEDSSLVIFIGKPGTKAKEDGTRIQTILNENISKLLSIDAGNINYAEKVKLLQGTDWFKERQPDQHEGLAYKFTTRG